VEVVFLLTALRRRPLTVSGCSDIVYLFGPAIDREEGVSLLGPLPGSVRPETAHISFAHDRQIGVVQETALAKNYVILNFSDYRAKDSPSDTRSTPIATLSDAFARRVERKGGSFSIHHMADLFGEIRLARHGKKPSHEVEGVLTEGWVRTLSLEAAVYRSGAWSAVLNSCREADKIIFAAHGHADDTDNVYTEDGLGEVRCGNVDGVVCFLNSILNGVKSDPTITLVVCYAARSAESHKHHINAPFLESDLRSSLAFKVFSGLSEFRPYIRLTARTGAVSAYEVGTSLTSETEEAIIAAEQIEAQFPNADEVISKTTKAYDDFDRALGKSNLSSTEKSDLRDRMYRWFISGFDPKELDEIIEAIDKLDWSYRQMGVSLLWQVGWSQTWSEANTAQVLKLKDQSALRKQLHDLHTIKNQKEAKYGKFIYYRYLNHIFVSRMHEGRITQLMRLEA
jgi:hypothetical protein